MLDEDTDRRNYLDRVLEVDRLVRRAVQKEMDAARHRPGQRGMTGLDAVEHRAHQLR